MEDSLDPFSPTVGQGNTGPDDDASLLRVFHTALCLQVDTVAADVSEQLHARGIPSVVLKGPSVASWLYDGGPVRFYGDADLLIAPEHWGEARELLEELGFVRELGQLAHPRMSSFTSEAWGREEDHVDLHCTLWGISASPRLVWNTLSAMTEPMQIGGRSLAVLTVPARALHLALHVAQHADPYAQPGTDLERAIEKLPFSTWEKAADLALRLDAVPAFAAGLRLIPEGAEIADRLNLPTASSLEASLRFKRAPLALGFEHLAQTSGIWRKLRLILSEVFPTPAFLRWWWPFASRGVIGLATAYVWRVIWVVGHIVPGYYTWQKARREAADTYDYAPPVSDADGGPPVNHHQSDATGSPLGASASR